MGQPAGREVPATGAGDPERDVSSWHERLLDASGVLPDDVVRRCRRWLADGRLEDVEHSMRFASRRASGHHQPSDWVLVAPWDADRLEAALEAASRGDERVHAAWSAVRVPADGAPWPPPTHVAVLEVRVDTPAAERIRLAADLADELAAAQGADVPLVEVVDRGTRRRGRAALAGQAQASGTLVWSAEDDAEIRVAVALSDAVAPGRPDEDVLDRVVTALVAAPVLATSSSRGTDRITGEADVVPVGARGDGRWAWPEAVLYYAVAHRRLPEPELVEHLLASGGRQVRLSAAARRRSIDAVLEVPAGRGWSGAVASGSDRSGAGQREEG